jgi:hypothetical protein
MARVPAILACGALIATVAGCSSSSNDSASGSPATGNRESGNPASGITIRFEESAQFELSLTSGRRIYIDVQDGDLLERQPVPNDVLLITNKAPHHYSEAFENGFPGQKMVATAGEMTLDDVHIVAIDASQTQQPVDHQYPGDLVFVVEAGGLRVAACGDLDQAQLEPEQLDAIGRIDVALCPISPSGVGVNYTDPYALDVVDQMHARLLIPTHASNQRAEAAKERWQATYSTKSALTITPDNLPATTTICFLGDQGSAFASILKLTETSAW